MANPSKTDQHSPTRASLRPPLGAAALMAGGLMLVASLYPFLWQLPDLHAGATSGYPGYTHAVDPPLSGWEDDRLVIRPDESAIQFAQRATEKIHQATYHCATVYDTHWLSTLLAQTNILRFRELGVLSAKHFRCGWCSQRAYILDRQLRHAGIDSGLLGLHGHVVTLFNIDDAVYIADPDYGVGPFQIDPNSEEHMSQAVSQYYGFLTQAMQDEVKRAYADISNDEPYYSAVELDQAADRQQRFLDAAERYKYLLPPIALALLLSGFYLLRGARSAATDSGLP